jgi:acetyl esterase/lipase
MRKIASELSLFFGIATRLHPRTGFGKLLLWIPKLLGSALSPILAFAGIVGFLAGVGKRKPGIALSGLIGSLLNTTHILKVTRESSSLAMAFGADFESRIPVDILPRLQSSRWSLATPAEAEVHRQDDLVVTSRPSTGEPLLADLWWPAEDTHPSGLGIIYLHGSGWHYGDKDLGTRPFFRHLAAQGHVILDLAYALAPKARLKDMLADVAHAKEWMQANGLRHGVRPDRIVLMGASAGGHLALLSAYLQTEQPAGDGSICGVVSYYGLTDLIALNRYLEGLYDSSMNHPIDRLVVRYLDNLGNGMIVQPKDMLPNLLGGSYAKIPEKYRAASPINHVGPHCPPTLQIFGAHDMAGVQQSILHLHQALIAAGVPSVYIEIPDCDHGFDLVFPQISPSAQTATYYTERFLAILSSDAA